MKTKYPKPIGFQIGAKVCFRFYDTRAEAEECAVAAKHNADIDERAGYDFGFYTPGEIREMDDSFRVCCP